MLIFLYLVFLCSNFLFIKSEDIFNVRIDVSPGKPCILENNYTFTEGQNVTLFIKPTNYINHGWWEVSNEAGSRNISSEINSGTGTRTNRPRHRRSNGDNPITDPTTYSHVVDKSMEGKWKFIFYLLENNKNYKADPKLSAKKFDEKGEQRSYIMSTCSTIVKIDSPLAAAASTSKNPNYTIIIACVVGAVLVAIIVAQAAYIMFLKAKAQKLITLNTHNNLSKKSDAAPDDTARYCSNPGQKMMKVADPEDDDDNRDSVIYEAPNIEIPGNPRMPMQPPQPPAITTMPRTPRPDHNMRINHQALNSSARSPLSENFPPNFQRPNHNDLANRPPLPLPNTLHDTPHTIPKHNPHDHNMFQEVYEEMDYDPMEENTYEPPPVINTMPPRLPMPPKKVPTSNLLDVKENTLTSRQGNRPPVTPKPAVPRSNTMIPPNKLEQVLRRRNDTMPKPTMTPMQQELAMRRRPVGDSKTNELEEALRRRNNDGQTNELEEALRRRNNAVKHVPILSIPDPSSKEPPKPRPQPPSKMKGTTIPHPVQDEIYYNENQASSDEEWTYEPLKPLNSYDTNIYNEIMQAPIVSNPDPSPNESSKPRPPPSKPWGPPTPQPHQVQDGPPQSKPRGPPIPHPVQEEIYYNENQASSDEEWIYEPLKPSHSYDCNS